MDHRNDPVAIYCLSLIAEEACELGQASAQALRFGLDTPSGLHGDGDVAKAEVAREIGNVLAAAQFAAAHGLLDMNEVWQSTNNKLAVLYNPAARDNLGRPLAPPVPNADPST